MVVLPDLLCVAWSTSIRTTSRPAERCAFMLCGCFGMLGDDAGCWMRGKARRNESRNPTRGRVNAKGRKRATVAQNASRGRRQLWLEIGAVLNERRLWAAARMAGLGLVAQEGGRGMLRRGRAMRLVPSVDVLACHDSAAGADGAASSFLTATAVLTACFAEISLTQSSTPSTHAE